MTTSTLSTFSAMVLDLIDVSWNFRIIVARSHCACTVWAVENLSSKVSESIRCVTAALSRKVIVLIDTLPGELSAKPEVLLPGATWVEKAGTFENAANRLQSFEQAIPVIELAKPEGQIALDLMAACGLAGRSIFDAAKVRAEMGGAFVTEVHHPAPEREEHADMEYVEL